MLASVLDNGMAEVPFNIRMRFQDVCISAKSC